MRVSCAAVDLDGLGNHGNHGTPRAVARRLPRGEEMNEQRECKTAIGIGLNAVLEIGKLKERKGSQCKIRIFAK